MTLKKSYNDEGTKTLIVQHQTKSVANKQSYAGKAPSKDGLRPGTETQNNYVQEAYKKSQIIFRDSRTTPTRKYEASCKGHVGLEEALKSIADNIRNYDKEGALESLTDREVVLNYFDRADEKKDRLIHESRELVKQACEITGDQDPFLDRDDMIRSAPCRLQDETVKLIEEMVSSKGYGPSWWDMPDHI